MKAVNRTNPFFLVIAILLPFVAFVIQYALKLFFEPYAWFLFFPAVYFSALISGLVGGVTATVISTALVWWFFLPLVQSFSLDNPHKLISTITFFCLGILFAFFQERMRQAGKNSHNSFGTSLSKKEQQYKTTFNEWISQHSADKFRSGRGEKIASPTNYLDMAPLVLIVEDDPDMNAFITEKFAQFYRVISAFDGQEGLTKALEIHPDIILIDVGMPVMSGDQMVRALQRHPEMADVPIVMLTADTDEQLCVELLKEGVQDYIFKPFSMKELLARVSRQITEKQKMDATIRDAYSLLYAVAESIPDVVYVKNTQGCYMMINAAGVHLLGRPKEEIIGKKDLDIFPLSAANEVMDEDREIMTQGEIRTRERTISIAGRDHTFLSNKAPFFNTRGEIVGVLGINTEITDRKRMEERINKLNRILSILNDINQAIVHIRDINPLLETACRIAVEKGKYQLAWVGVFDEATQKINPIASAGKSEEYFSKIIPSLVDEPGSRCPIDAAIRSGEHSVCADIGQDNEPRECQKIALDLGIRSAASFPLRVAGAIRATITLYSDEPNSFNEDELNLLDDMALSLSFAIEYIETEEKRKQFEEVSRKTGILLSEMGKMVKAGAWELDVETMKQVWTEEVYRIHELDLSFNPTESNAIEFYPPESKPIIERIVHNCIEYGEPFDVEVEFVTAKGNRRWVHTIGKAFQEKGKTKKVFGTFQDITERKLASETLQKSEIRFQNLFENMLNGFAYCQMINNEDGPQDFVYLNVNQAFEKLTGLKDVTGKKVTEVIPGISESDPELLNIYGRVALTGVPETFERYIVAMKMWFSVAVYSPQKGFFVAIFDVITERKQAEAALRESEERLRAFFMSGMFGALYGDVFGNIKTANDEYLKIVGYTREDLEQGKLRWIEITPAEFIPFDNAGIAQAREFGVCTPYEKQFIRKDGTRVWVLVGYVLVGPERNDSIAFILDLTNIKQKEEEILKLNIELEQRVLERTRQLENANKELEAFTYSVSHDLRAPLRAIDGFSNILVEDYANLLGPEGNHVLDVIRKNATKMDQLITNLLALSKTTRVELKYSRIDMAELAHSIFDEVAAPDIREKFTFSVSNIPLIYGDIPLIRQVWINLLSNAIKYTLPKDDRRINVGGYIEDNMAVYYVKDTGVGFDPDYTDKLFGVFQRLHKTEEFEGTGVGLAIVQRIIARHGGRTWAEGQVNQGATIYFSIPVKGDGDLN